MKRIVATLAFSISLWAGVESGSLPEKWATGGPDCAALPAWEVHAYNSTFYILRESGCIHYEKPFLYLLFGDRYALLEDTGAGNVDTAAFVSDLIAKWAKAAKRASPKLLVVHSHAHGDHTAGDKALRAAAEVEFVEPTAEAISKRAGIPNWPESQGQIDLGERILDIIPIPGHNDASIAIYDRKTGILLTGDSLYPGRLYVNAADVDTYAASARRLAQFARAHEIAHVLGTHVEQRDTPFLDYERGTNYQPAEHSLALSRAHIYELNDAFANRKEGNFEPIVLPDFTVSIRAPRPTR